MAKSVVFAEDRRVCRSAETVSIAPRLRRTQRRSRHGARYSQIQRLLSRRLCTARPRRRIGGNVIVAGRRSELDHGPEKAPRVRTRHSLIRTLLLFAVVAIGCNAVSERSEDSPALDRGTLLVPTHPSLSAEPARCRLVAPCNLARLANFELRRSLKAR
jgi:hypothetical protein